MKAISGYIIEIKDNSSISVISITGEQYYIVITDCTLLLASTEKYKLSAGDMILVKGSQKGKLIVSNQLTTVR